MNNIYKIVFFGNGYHTNTAFISAASEFNALTAFYTRRNMQPYANIIPASAVMNNPVMRYIASSHEYFIHTDGGYYAAYRQEMQPAEASI